MTSPAAARPTWTRRVSGSSLAGFFVMTAGLWIASILAWNGNQLELGVVLLALGAFFPLLWVTIRVRMRPIWALRIRGDTDAVADQVRAALIDLSTIPVAAKDPHRDGLFRGLETLVRVENPRALIGFGRAPGDASTTLLLVPESNDRAAVEALKLRIAETIPRQGQGR